ncbi:LysR family transcriptional regulator [Thiotrichales bacterium 19S3-7]|nr:LysR family transcriptional regulator [Thiotrichales bacterium 19S3-7]MCF6802600.1 LysR family transcriptional regulator [Thiotrichales bacterium 19S3-11]
MVTLKQLQLFLMLAKYERLTIAAEKCFLSQPAASLALKELELRLNVKLFDRIGRNLVLNANGLAIRSKTQTILEAAEEIQGMLKGQSSLKANLSLGASMTVGNYFLPRKLIKFNQLYPNLTASLMILNSQKIIDKLTNYEIDFGFVEDEVIDDRLIKIPLKKDQLVIIAREGHPLSNVTFVMMEHLCDFPWVFREKGSGTRNIIEKKIIEYQLQLKVILELGSNEAILEAVRHSDALACVSKSILKTNTGIIKINQNIVDLSRYFYLLVYKEKYQSEAMKTLLSFLSNATV